MWGYNGEQYTPQTGSFLTRDRNLGSAQEPITQNRYAYGGANPVLYKDPSGHRLDADGPRGPITNSAENVRLSSHYPRPSPQPVPNGRPVSNRWPSGGRKPTGSGSFGGGGGGSYADGGDDDGGWFDAAAAAAEAARRAYEEMCRRAVTRYSGSVVYKPTANKSGPQTAAQAAFNNLLNFKSTNSVQIMAAKAKMDKANQALAAAQQSITSKVGQVKNGASQPKKINPNTGVSAANSKKQEVTNSQKANDSTAQYVSAIYALDKNGANILGLFNAGHTAVILTKSDGTGVIYNFGGDGGAFSQGYMMTHLDENKKTASFDVNDFLKTGNVQVNHEGLIKNKEEPINNFKQSFTDIIIYPITNEDGNRATAKGEERKENPGEYNLFLSNCDQTSKQILLAAGINTYTGVPYDPMGQGPMMMLPTYAHQYEGIKNDETLTGSISDFECKNGVITKK